MIQRRKKINKYNISSKYLIIIKNNKVHFIKKKKKKSNIKYLYYNKKLKNGIFLKTPKFKELSYPFLFNFKLINQFLKKK